MKMKIGKINFQGYKDAFVDIYSLKDEDAKGRLISLGSALVTAFYNVFITGVFYTGFLSMYGMSISDVGIISYIPLIANCFSVFSSVILERIKKRKWICIGSKIFFYALYIVATTLMPQFVHDTRARLYWFAAILFVAHAVYALFSPGFTPWFYAFYPTDNARRTRYISLNQIFSSIMSSAMLIFSSLLTDAMADTPYQDALIIGLRYFAFALVLIDVFMQSRAIEYPYPPSPKIKFSQVFTLPFRYKKFIAIVALMFYWNYVANLNANIWNYHLLNHFGFSYTLMNAVPMLYTVILICTSSLWQKVVRKYSWVKTFGISILWFMPTELFFFIMTKETTWMFVPLCIWQYILSVGMNLSYSNLLYLNLPEENSTAHIAFYSIGCNLCAFLGLLTGTKIAAISGDSTFMFMGLEMYSVQFTTLARAITIFALSLVCIFGWKWFTPDHEIAEVEANLASDRKLKEMGLKPNKIRWKLPKFAKR